MVQNPIDSLDSWEFARREKYAKWRRLELNEISNFIGSFHDRTKFSISSVQIFSHTIFPSTLFSRSMVKDTEVFLSLASFEVINI